MSISGHGGARRSRALLAALITLSALSVPARPAAAEQSETFTVTTLLDPLPGECVPGDCSLREAVIAANTHVNIAGVRDTIVLPRGEHRLTRETPEGESDTPADGDLDILEGVIITGAGSGLTTVTGDDIDDRAFDVSPTTVDWSYDYDTGDYEQVAADPVRDIDADISRLTIHRGAARDEPSTSEYDEAENREFGTYEANNGYGGAIRARTTGTVTLADVVLVRNTADDKGGAVGMDGADANESPVGTLSLTNVAVSLNHADYGGGGVHCDTCAAVTVAASTFTDNNADDNGGAIDCTICPSLTVTAGSTFSGNTAAYGGAMDMDGPGFYDDRGRFVSDRGSVTIADSTFTANTATNEDGGMLRCSPCSAGVTVTDSVLENNVATDQGGLIFCTTCGGAQYDDDEDPLLDDDGTWAHTTSVTITRSTVTGSSANVGGVIDCVFCIGGVQIVDTAMTGNTAGRSSGGAVNCYSCGAEGQDADGNTVRLPSLRITGSTLDGNHANQGGAFACSSCPGTVEITGSTLDRNTSRTAGGAVYCSSCGAGISVTDTSLSGNAVTIEFEEGGAIFCSSCGDSQTDDNGDPVPDLLIADSVLDANKAGGDGGAVSCSSCPDVEISGSSLSGNTALDDDHGGAVYCADCDDVRITDSTLDRNRAGEYGGAMDCDGCSIAISGSSLSSNVARDGGAAIDCGNCAGLRITDSALDGNLARDREGGAVRLVICDGCSGVSGSEVDTANGDEVPFGISGSSLSGNEAFLDGGAIHVSTDCSGDGCPALRVSHSTLTTNVSQTGRGGAIASYGARLELVDGVVEGNLARTNGGGVYAGRQEAGAVTTITRTALVDNQARRGGGFYNGNGDTATLTNVTIAGNRADTGGGIHNAGAVALSHATLSDNTAQVDGGGVHDVAPPVDEAGVSAVPDGRGVVFDHTLVADNTADDLDNNCGAGGDYRSHGHNLVDDDSCVFDEERDTDTVGLDVTVPAAADNGGDTLTVRLAADSAAVDAGSATCGDQFTDQRGESRPADGDGDDIIACDIGAFERQPDEDDAKPRPRPGGGGGGGGAPPPLTCTLTTSSACTVADGGTVHSSSSPPTEENPVVASVTTPNGGVVTIVPDGQPGDVGDGFTALGVSIDITAPNADEPEDPLVLVFAIHGSKVPEGVGAADVEVFRNGVLVPDCAGPAGHAVPDPCIDPASRRFDDDVLTFTVHTTAASTWTFGVETTPPPPPPPPPPSGSCEGAPHHGFTDVRADNVHEAAIACAKFTALTRGLTATTYGPGRPVLRAQMASFVANAIRAAGASLPAAGDAFDDDDGNAHEANIDALAAAGIVRGIDTAAYAPDLPVTRDQMATFLVKAHDYVADAWLPSAPDRFSDDDGNAHERNIDKAAAAGLTTGKSPSRYDPHANVRRDQMASFLTRLVAALR